MKTSLMPKKKLKKYSSDKLREECGAFNLNYTDASVLVALATCLKYRGQEGCGIVSLTVKFSSEKRQGLVGIILRTRCFKKLPGSFAIGHNRYSTTGETSLRNIQPFSVDLHMYGLALLIMVI